MDEPVSKISNTLFPDVMACQWYFTIHPSILTRHNQHPQITVKCYYCFQGDLFYGYHHPSAVSDQRNRTRIRSKTRSKESIWLYIKLAFLFFSGFQPVLSQTSQFHNPPGQKPWQPDTRYVLWAAVFRSWPAVPGFHCSSQAYGLVEFNSHPCNKGHVPE